MLIDIGTEEGAVGKAEGELLGRAFALGDRQVSEVMVPRTEVVALEKGTTIADFYRLFAQTLHSRFPVYEESLDKIMGLVVIKDVLRGIATGQMRDDSPIETFLRQALFVPETKLIGGLLPWADQLFACGPTPMFAAIAAVMRQARSRKPVQALLEERMGCGTGVCYGCAVFTRRGVRLVCRDGPRFELREAFT